MLWGKGKGWGRESAYLKGSKARITRSAGPARRGKGTRLREEIIGLHYLREIECAERGRWGELDPRHARLYLVEEPR